VKARPARLGDQTLRAEALARWRTLPQYIDSTFQRSFSALYDERLMPAFRQYRDFLEHEYLPSARDDIAVAVNPDGTACYAAVVRLYSSLPVSPRQVKSWTQGER
jgi:uncharacterized protein (DUF885 family)